MTERITRCQAAVLRGDRILLVKHTNLVTGRTYWWLPGGGCKPGETQEEAVVREVKEEICLDVRVERLLFVTQDPQKRYAYRRFATYLCTPLSGESALGAEGYESGHPIVEMGWFSLWDESAWLPAFREEHLYPFLQSIRSALQPHL